MRKGDQNPKLPQIRFPGTLPKKDCSLPYSYLPVADKKAGQEPDMLS